MKTDHLYQGGPSGYCDYLKDGQRCRAAKEFHPEKLEPKPPYPDHDCPACNRNERVTEPPTSSVVGSAPVHRPSGQVCLKYIKPELLRILEGAKYGQGVISPAPQPIFYNFEHAYDRAFVALYNMVIFALQQNKAGQIAWTCPTMLEAEKELTLRVDWLKHKERCNGPTGCLDDGDELSIALRQLGRDGLNKVLSDAGFHKKG